MKILITGITGFIGQNLSKLLLNKDYEIYCIIRNSSDKSKIDKRVKLFEYDGNIENLIKFFQNEKFDGIVHLASLFLLSHTNKDISNLISSNVLFGSELLEASSQTNVKWFINTGTFWQHYKNEDYNPVNLYAATKEAFEKIAKYYTQTSKLIFTTIKLNDTFGSNDTRNKIFNLWTKISETKELLEMSPGEQIIDISFVEDIINSYSTLIGHLNSNDAFRFNNQEFVVTNKDRLNLKDLSKLFEKTTNTTLNIKWAGKEYRDREVMIPYNKGKTVPNWKQEYTLEKAIKKTIEEKHYE